MATSPFGPYADISRYQQAAAQPVASPLDALIQGFQGGQAIRNLPQTLAQNALEQQVALAVNQAKLRALQTGEIKQLGNSLYQIDPMTGQPKLLVTAPTSRTTSPFQLVGQGQTTEGALSGVVFDPNSATFKNVPFPGGISNIGPKTTSPKTSQVKSLTPNAQNALFLKAGSAGIDPNDPRYIDEQTGAIDFTKLAFDTGKTARQIKNEENAAKASGLTGKTKSDIEALNAAEKQLGSLQDEILDISKSGKTPGFFDNALAAVTASPPNGFFSSLVNQGADYLQSDDSKYLEGKKSVISSALTKAISGLAVSASEAQRLGFIPKPGESFESLVRKVGLVEDYINNQRSGLSQGSTVPSPVSAPTGGTKVGRFTLIP